MLIESTISFFCAMAPAVYNGSCSKALEATSMKISVGERVNPAADVAACQRAFGADAKKEDIIACSKSKEFTITEVSAREEIGQTENQFQQYMLKEAYDTVGKRVIDTLGSAAFIYKIYTDQKLTFDIPNAKVCDTIHADLTPSSYGLRLQWSFK